MARRKKKKGEKKMMKLKSKNPRYAITRNTLDYPEAHFGFSYDVFDKHRNMLILDGRTKRELNILRKRLRF